MSGRELTLLPTTPAGVRSLYRRLLWHAARFPSKKRAAVLSDIKAEFRDGARLQPGSPAALAALEVAVRGLETMAKYTTGLPRGAADWSVTLEQDPLGEREAIARRAGGGGGGGGGEAGKPRGRVVDAGVASTFGRIE